MWWSVHTFTNVSFEKCLLAARDFQKTCSPRFSQNTEFLTWKFIDIVDTKMFSFLQSSLVGHEATNCLLPRCQIPCIVCICSTFICSRSKRTTSFSVSGGFMLTLECIKYIKVNVQTSKMLSDQMKQTTPQKLIVAWAVVMKNVSFTGGYFQSVS